MHQSNVFFLFGAKKSQGFEGLLVNDSKSTHEFDVKVVNILKMDMYLLCMVLG